MPCLAVDRNHAQAYRPKFTKKFSSNEMWITLNGPRVLTKPEDDLISAAMIDLAEPHSLKLVIASSRFMIMPTHAMRVSDGMEQV